MNRRFGAVLVGTAILNTVLWTPMPSLAQKSAKPAAKLPSAQNILDDASVAMGSKAAFDRIKTMKMRGSISMPAQNIKGSMLTQMKFPDKIYVVQEISGFGKAEQGFDGKVGWSRDPINGLRTLAGGELKQMKRQSDEVRSSDWRKLYEKPVLIGVRKVGTANTYAIKMTPKGSDKAITTYYDIKTKLPIRTDMVVETAQGSIPTQSFVSDYRTMNGVKIPFKTRQVVGGVSEVNVVFDSVQINAPVDDKLFTKPAAAAASKAAPATP